MANTPLPATAAESSSPEGMAYERIRNYARQLERSQQELSQQTSVLRSVLDSISDGVVVADRDGHLLRFNSAAQQILGMGVTDAIIDEWSDRYGCFLPDSVTSYPAHDLPLARAIRGEIVNDGEIFIRHAQRPQGLWISVNAAPLRDAGGDLVGGVAAFRDITARKRLDDALKTTADELARSNLDLQQFAYVVSHDLQKPLRKVSRFCTLLEQHCQGMLDVNALQLMGFIVDSAGRMEKLIRNLLTLARVGRGGTQFGPVDLGAIFQQAKSDLEVAPEMLPAITFAGLPLVRGDATQLGQLALNLLDNALKYQSARQPSIQVTAERQGNEWLVAVHDNGIGIDASLLERIFEIFQRAQSQATYPGTGLGLAICKRIVENHGGRIWAESQKGQGTTFFFTLPESNDARPTCPG
jgi:PAS domain S-box-containing protein